MDLTNLKQYQSRFFEGTWFKDYHLNESSLFHKIQDRTDLLLDGQIIYNDAMDMEPHKVPYSINKYKWNDYPEMDPEWVFMLSRQGFMVDLAICYKITNDKRYLSLWKELCFDFIENNGQPNEDNELSWRPLDAGIRLSNLIKSFLYLDLENDFSVQDRKAIFKAIVVHKTHLFDTYMIKYDLSNWGVLALSGLMQAQLIFPDLLTDQEEHWVWEKIKSQINIQFFNDGVHWEQSPLYHHEVLMNYAFILNVAEYVEAELPFDLRKDLLKPAEMAWFYTNDKGYLNPINDSDAADFNYVYDIYRYMNLLKGKVVNKDAQIFVGNEYISNYQENELNHRKEFHDGQASGFYAVKNKDSYITFFNGLHGSSHGHAATGSMTLEMNGDPLFIATGRYSYIEDELRIALKREEAHNSVQLLGATATEIVDSWSYSKLANPISHSIREVDFGYIINGSWTAAIDTHRYAVVNRTILFFEKIQVTVLFDKVIGYQGEVHVNYNLAPDLELKNVTSEEIELQGKDTTYKIWNNQSDFKVDDTVISQIYNQKEASKRIVSSFDKDTPISSHITVISPENAQAETVYATQNRKEGSTDYVDGVKITVDETSFELYFLKEDVVSGDKLFLSQDGIPFFGYINLIDDEGYGKQY